MDRYTYDNGSNIEMLGLDSLRLSIKVQSLIHQLLIAKHATCNMIEQDAILRLELVIDGTKYHIQLSHENN